MTYRASYLSPLGAITLASDGKALTGLWFDGQKYFGSTLPVETKQGDCPVFAQAKRWLDSYFAGEKPDFTPPLHWAATPFRRAVWEILLTVPYGCTTTYGQIAAQLADRMGKPQSAQAVGGAVGHNPISLIVPCHRVVVSGSRGVWMVMMSLSRYSVSRSTYSAYWRTASFWYTSLARMRQPKPLRHLITV